MFLSEAKIKQAVADKLSTDVANLASHWDGIIKAAHVSAYNQIVSRLLARGFTLAQVTAWDDGPEYEKDLSVFRALNDGGSLGAFSDTAIKVMDRRAELDKMGSLIIVGVWTRPGNTDPGPGLVGTGSFDTNGATFVPFDPDAQTGEFTRW